MGEARGVWSHPMLGGRVSFLIITPVELIDCFDVSMSLYR